MRALKSWFVGLAAAFAAQSASAATTTTDTAKWLLHDFRRPAANNAEFEKFHQGAVYDNHETTCPKCTVMVSSSKDQAGAFADLKFILPRKGSTPFYANTGILFPLDPWWTSDNDLRNLVQIRFKARVMYPPPANRADSASYLTEATLGVAFDGPASPFASAGFHPVYSAYVYSINEWEWMTIDLSEFSYSPWMTNDAQSGSKTVAVFRPDADGNLVRSQARLNNSAIRGRILNVGSANLPNFDNDSVNILKHVRSIKFFVEPLYTNDGLSLYPNTGNKLDLQLDSIQFVGVAPTWPPVHGSLCHGTSALLDDFSATKADRSRNLLGGAWWAVSDTDTFHPQAPGTGMSLVHSNTTPWSPSPERGAASLVADLDRIDPDQHPDAGWASLFTNVPAKSLESLKAISMKIRAEGSDSVPFDSSRVQGVVFRAIGPGFADSLVYEARIPFRQMRSDSSICLDLSELRQPAWYSGSHGIRRVVPRDILRFSWSLVLQDPSATKAATSRIDLKEVRLWGLEPTTAIHSRSASDRGIGIRVQDGIRLSYSVPGPRATIRVVRTDGRTISISEAPATVSDMPLPENPGRGTYAIEVTGSGTRKAAMFTIP